MTTPPVKMWRYSLPSVQHEGWAIIHLDSKGFFAAVSDYGNYAYLWTHHGYDDFREFFVRSEFGDYFTAKLSSGRRQELREPETLEAIRRDILRMRREDRLSKEDAREEWDLAEALEYGNIVLAQWHEHTRLQDAGELPRYGPPRDCEAFVAKILPRLAEAIRAELEQEAQVAA